MWDDHFNYSNCKESGEQDWRSGESTHLPPLWPGFDSWTQHHKWAEFVDSPFCSERFFSGYSGFPLSPKTNIWFDLICNLNNYCDMQVKIIILISAQYK